MKTKMKPKKALKGRFKVTGTGKIMRNRPGKRHILTKKSSNRKRRLGKAAVLHQSITKLYSRLMGV